MNNEYKIVFIDIDGTLVNDEKIVPEENIKMIQTLKKNGIEVVLASGRPYHSIEKYSTQVGAIPYIIGSNGGIVANFVEDKKIFAFKISVGSLAKLSAVAERYALTHLDKPLKSYDFLKSVLP